MNKIFHILYIWSLFSEMNEQIEDLKHTKIFRAYSETAGDNSFGK